MLFCKLAWLFPRVGAVISAFFVSLGLLTATVSAAFAQSSYPTIDFISPASGASFASPANISLRVNVTDPENRVRRIEYWANESRGGGIHYPGAFINSATMPPYAVTWPNVTGGTHKISAIAKDELGNYIRSVPITVVVTGSPNSRPTVRIREPVQGSSLVSNTAVVFKVDASDVDGSVSCVRFNSLGELGSIYIGQDCYAPYTFTWDPRNGNYTVQALAIDNVGQSNGAVVDFAIGNRRPTVSITSPAYGSTVTPGQQFTAAAAASDTDGQIVKVEFWDQVGGTRYGADSVAPYTQALVAPQNGSINVVAIAYDNDGATGQSTPMRLEVVNYAPIRIDVTSPTAGTSFRAPANIPITAAVVDPQQRITSVEFFAQTVDATSLLGVDSTAPYTFDWNAVPAGAYSISARAYTAESGTIAAVQSLQVRINVFEGNSPPTVSLTSPADLSTYTEPATVQVAAVANDSDGSIARVEFYLGDGAVATDDVPPYEISWTGVSARASAYHIYAKAYDQRGAYSTSAVRSITVNPAPQAPDVAITAPRDGQAFIFPASVQLSAAAADADGTISKVELYANQQLIYSSSAPPFVFAWNPTAVGSYSLVAKAFDNTGLSALSDPVVVSIATRPNEVLHFYHSDAQGSIVAVSDAAGQGVTSTSYRPFGQVAAGTGQNAPTRLGFTGKLRDTDLEFSYFGARFYDPVYGRFIGLDPVDFDPGDLQSFSRYTYANNNPFSFVDPDGRQISTAPWRWAYARDTVPQALIEGAGEGLAYAADRGGTLGVGFYLCGCDPGARNAPGDDSIESVSTPLENSFGGGVVAAARWTAAASAGRSELAHALSAFGRNAFGRNIKTLKKFGEGAGFSGVYDVASGKFLAYASGTTRLANGGAPRNLVEQLQGHLKVNENLAGLLGTSSTNRLGFSMVLQKDGSFRMGWNSRSINLDNPDVDDFTIPISLRRMIIDAIQLHTGRQAQ